MKYADLILPWGRKFVSGKSKIAINFLVQNLEHMIVKRGFVIENLTNAKIEENKTNLNGGELKTFNLEQVKHLKPKLMTYRT